MNSADTIGVPVECGYAENADINVAINIQRAGHARLACEVNGAVMPSAAGTRRSDSSRNRLSAVGIPVLIRAGGCQETDSPHGRSVSGRHGYLWKK